MKIFYKTLVVLLAFAAVLSCRKMSDPVSSFLGSETFVNYEASKSLSSQFKSFWKAMNSNYATWDEELTYGIDWDEIYQKYLPKFEELDKVYDAETNPIPDEYLKEIYSEIINPLHNGHLSIEINNYHTGTRFTFSPLMTRIIEKLGEKYNNVSCFFPRFDYYEGLPEDDERHAEVFDGGFFGTLPEGDEYLADFIQSSLIYECVGIRTYFPMFEEYFDSETADHLVDFYENFIKCLSEAAAIFDTDKTPGEQLESFYAYYYDNLMELEMSQENESCLGFEVPVDGSSYKPDVNEEYLQDVGGIMLKSALIGGDIPYIWANNFTFGAFLEPESLEHYSQSRTMTFLLRRASKCWQKWFDDIQKLSAQGKLKGVIIDVRTNHGGYAKDIQYFPGALTNKSMEFGYCRVKDGPGRFDYSPFVPYQMFMLPQDHAEVSCPIVVICNSLSASMSEHVALAVSEMSNGTVVGTTTLGACAVLNESNSIYSVSYSGTVGKKGEGAFYISNSLMSFLDKDKKSLESLGITPKPENYIELDFDALRSTGRDNQLERALEIINGR